MRKLTSHGWSRTSEYGSWQQLRQRCENPRAKSYDNYGGRGITVCAAWSDFSTFLKDMGPRPSALHSIDRIDNNGPYSPENCQWTVIAVQLRNRRNNVVLSLDGKSLTITDWAAQIGLAVPTIQARLRRGWTVREALTMPGDDGAKSKSAHRLITFNGQTRSLADWNRSLGGSPTTLLCRLKAGWSVERALTTPIAHR